MEERHAFARLVVCGDFVELYKYSSPIPVGKTRSYEIVRDKSSDSSKEKRLDNLLRARHKIRRVIWANQCPYTKFITLTYSNTVLDVLKVRNDIKNFVRNMRRKGYDMKYLYVLENQKKRGEKEGNAGSLHVHMVLFVSKKIPLAVLNSCWKHGFVDVGAARKINNLGAYVCKYLTKDNLQDFGSHAYVCSLGLSRGSEEVFYTEGFSTSTVGLHPDEILKDLSVHYHSQSRFDFLDCYGLGRVQIVQYYQAKIPKNSYLRLLGHGLDISFFDECAFEDSRIADPELCDESRDSGDRFYEDVDFL